MPLSACQCIGCQSSLQDRLASDLSSYLRPLFASLIEAYHQALDQLAAHPLNRERDDEMVAQVLDGMAIACSQIKNSRAMGLAEKIEELRTLMDRMTTELVEHICYHFLLSIRSG